MMCCAVLLLSQAALVRSEVLLKRRLQELSHDLSDASLQQVGTQGADEMLLGVQAGCLGRMLKWQCSSHLQPCALVGWRCLKKVVALLVCLTLAPCVALGTRITQQQFLTPCCTTFVAAAAAVLV